MKRPLTAVLSKKTEIHSAGQNSLKPPVLHYELSICHLLSTVLSSHCDSISIAMTHLFPVCFPPSLAFPFLLKALNGSVILSYREHRDKKCN